MKITKDKLKEIAETFLRILEREKAETFRDLERLAGQTIPVEGKEHDYLMVSWRPSNLGTKALNIEYVIQHRPREIEGGIPLNVRINHQLAYSQIILKCCAEIPDYIPFNKDPFDNIMQSKRLMASDWALVQEEIRRLL